MHTGAPAVCKPQALRAVAWNKIVAEKKREEIVKDQSHSHMHADAATIEHGSRKACIQHLELEQTALEDV